MGQIVAKNAKPKRCNIQAIQSGGSLYSAVLKSGEYMLVSSNNSMDTNGNGLFDNYVIGDGITSCNNLILHTITPELEDKADKADTYTKTEVNNIIPSVDNDIIIGALPSSGVANTIYRVPGTNSYTDYAWNGTQFVTLGTFTGNGDIDAIPMEGSIAPVQSGGVYDALQDIKGKVILPVKYTNGYIKTSDPIGTTIDVDVYVNLSPWMCYVSECKAGNIIFVSGTGGLSPRLWAFLDSDYKIISQSAASTTANNLPIVAPTNAAWVIVNDNSGKTSYIQIPSSITENALKLDYKDENSQVYTYKLTANHAYDLSPWSDSAYNAADVYYEPITKSGRLSSVKIKGYEAQKVKIYVCNINTASLEISGKTLACEISIETGEHIYDLSAYDFDITEGQYIGTNYPRNFYFKIGSVPSYRERNGTLVSTYNRTAEEYTIKEGIRITTFDVEQLAKIAESHDAALSELEPDIEQLQNNVEVLSQKTAENEFRFNYVPFYRSSDFSDWSDYDHDNRGIWTRSNNTITPSAVGGYINNYLCGAIYYPKRYESKRIIYRFEAVLYSTTILNVHFCREEQTGRLPNESMFSIDCSTGTLKMYELNGRYISNVVKVSSEISFGITNGRTYIVECEKKITTYSLKLIDSVTGESSIVVNSGNWDAGTMQNMLCFTWGGGTAPVISKVTIYEPEEVRVLFVGDSITEGVGVTDKSKSFPALIINDIVDGMVSAAASNIPSDINQRLTSEILKNKPTHIFYTIGTNLYYITDVQTIKPYLDAVVDFCTTNGINLILNHIPMFSGHATFVEQYNQLIDTYNLDCVRMDVATALNNNPSDGINSSLFADGTHPNELGCQKIYERAKIDVPYLFVKH